MDGLIPEISSDFSVPDARNSAISFRIFVA